jgi:hypothetical protein
MGRCLALLSVGTALLAVGCKSALPSCEAPAAVVPSEYTLVEYRLRDALAGAPEVATTDTETYRAEHARYAAAALRLPDSCLKEGALPGPDAATGASPLLQEPCAAWLVELERALAAAGFRLLAWDAVLKLEREKSLPTHLAAKELGAEVVFVFNGIDVTSVTASSVKLPKHEYFESDEHGRRGTPLTLDERTRSAFLQYTLGAAGKSIPPESIIALSASLDATAIVTQTGESIWSYRRSTAVRTKAKQGLKLLFGRVAGGGWTPAAPVAEEIHAVKGATPAPSTDPSHSTGVPPGDDTLETARAELVRAFAEHFVQSFKSGQAGTSGSEDGDR